MDTWIQDRLAACANEITLNSAGLSPSF